MPQRDAHAFIASLMRHLMEGGARKRKQESKLSDMQRWTGGYTNPTRQDMFLRDYFRTGRIQDPFSSYFSGRR
jgi:hypothetical protein